MYMADCLETLVTNQFLLLFYLHSQIHRSRVLNSLLSCNMYLLYTVISVALVDFRMVRVHVIHVHVIVSTVLWLEHQLAVITCTVYWPLSSHWRTPLIWLPINIANFCDPSGMGDL